MPLKHALEGSSGMICKIDLVRFDPWRSELRNTLNRLGGNALVNVEQILAQ